METVKNMYGTHTNVHIKDSLCKCKLENLKKSSNVSHQIKKQQRFHNLVYSKLERYLDYILKVARNRLTKHIINAN